MLARAGTDAGAYLQPRSRRAAPDRSRRCSSASCASCTTRERRASREDWRTRHGLRHAVLARGHRSRTTPEFATATRRPPNCWPTSRRYLAIGGVVATHPTHRRPGRRASRAALERVAPGGFDVRFGSKFEPPLLEDGRGVVSRRRLRRGRRPGPRAALIVDVDRPVHESRAKAALGDEVDFLEIGAWYDAPGLP